MFKTAEICIITKKNSQVALKWARENNVSYKGEGAGKRYSWTQKNLDDFSKYSKKNKVGRKSSKELKKTENFDTLYHRLLRSKKNGNIELYNQTRKLLDNLKNK